MMDRHQRRAATKGANKSEQPAGAALLFAAALAHHQAGRLAEAEAGYCRLLAVAPDHADAAFNLGVAARQLGKFDDAITAYRLAIRITPDYPEAHYNLGNALMARGLVVEAVAAYAQALSLKPDHSRANGNLALAYVGLGVALFDQGKHGEAVAAFDRALAIKPDLVEAHYNLGNAFKVLGRLDDAAAAYGKAIGLNPNLTEAYSNLGTLLVDLGKVDDAIAIYAQALRIKPDAAELHYNLGNALKDQGKLDAASAFYARAIVLKPDYAEAHANLGIALMNQGRIGEAVAAYAQASALKPDDAGIHSNLLFCLNYDASRTPEQLFAAHRDWDARYGTVPRPASYANARAPERRLKIGYVSPDFRTHSVAQFLTPLLEHHDRQATELFCYADVMRPDAVTDHLRNFSDHWLSAVTLSDEALAERIQADGIDILVDLAGHTSHNRMRVFARKPAPVQATWLGYANTTGLANIDYRIVDAVTDPPGAADACASETLLRLPDGFLCYGGPRDAPPLAPPPCIKNEFITFGSFNNPAKVSPATFDVWARLLARLPDAHLLLKGKPFADPATCASYMEQLHERGVAVERVELSAWQPGSDAHLMFYEKIDIALDPFPYNGTTTTCEALWMGVPVITLRGDRHSARVGASLLSQIGLTDWIALSADDYVEIARALAGNRERLQELRQSLRRRLAASSLCDGPGFARKMETAFREMWKRWCETALPELG